MDTIYDDFDELEARDAKEDAARLPKTKILELPFVKKRIKEITQTRIEPASRARSANAEYQANLYREEGYLIQERLRDSARFTKNGKPMPENLSDEQAENLKSAATKKIEEEWADHLATGERMAAENKKHTAILNDRHLIEERLKPRSQELGSRHNVIEHVLDEVDYDEDAYQEALVFIKNTPAKIRKLSIKSSYRSKDEMLADIPAQLAKAKARWVRSVRLGSFAKRATKRRGRTGDIPLPMVDGPLIPGVGNMPVPVDPMAFLAEFFPDKFTATLERTVADFAKNNDVAASENAQKQVDELKQRLRAAEILEEQMIRAAQRVGIMLPRRQNAKLGLVFDFRRAK